MTGSEFDPIVEELFREATEGWEPEAPPPEPTDEPGVADPEPEPATEPLPVASTVWDVPITLLAHRHIKGGDTEGVTHSTFGGLRKPIGLPFLYTQYVEPSCIRLDHRHTRNDITFNFCIFDIDTEGKAGCTDDEHLAIIRHLEGHNLTPTVTYRSASGIHLVFWVKPTKDVAWFQAKRFGLQELIVKAMASYGDPKFEIDQLKDWQRLVYCPRIIRLPEGGKRGYDLRKRKIHLLIDQPLDLGNRAIPEVHPYASAIGKGGTVQTSTPGTQVYNGMNRKLDDYCSEVVGEGLRHNRLRDVVWHLLKTYRHEDHKHFAKRLISHAQAEGLSDYEIATLVSVLSIDIEDYL